MKHKYGTKHKWRIALAILICLIAVFIAKAYGKTTKVIGIYSKSYFGQELTGEEAQLFHPEQFGDEDRYLFSISFSNDGKECMLTTSQDMRNMKIKYAKILEGKWTDLTISGAFGDFNSFEPIFNPNGREIVFGTIRPLPGTDSTKFRQWYLVRKGNDWRVSGPLPEPFISMDIMYLTKAQNGNAYFTATGGLYCSKLVNGKYQEPEKLNINSDWFKYPEMPCISPDDSYLVYKAHNEDGDTDLIVTFRNNDGSWRKAQSLGNNINSILDEYCPFITADNNYLFFSRKSEDDARIYWVSTEQILNLKKLD